MVPSTRFGNGKYTYEVVPGWGDLPEGWDFLDVVGVGVDSRDNVYVLNRGAHPIVIFDRGGEVLGSFCEGQFNRPHGLCMGPDDSLYCVDDCDHTLKKFSPDGRLLMTLGSSGQPSDTGYDPNADWPERRVKYAAGPYAFPTNVAISPKGEIYVSDGYANARVHRFTPDGELVLSWGAPGDGPGEFWIPHGIAVDRFGVVYVADRENSRVQVFSPDGEFLREWPQVYRPTEVFIDKEDTVFVTEFGYRAGPVDGQINPPGEQPRARVSVRSLDGSILAFWGEGPDDCAPGFFFAPHAVCTDSRGDLYVGEVIRSAGQNGKLVSVDCHTLQKFVRVS